MMTLTSFPPGTPTKIAHIAINGDDATAELDNIEKPFRTMEPIMKILQQQAEKKEFMLQIKDIGYLPEPRVAAPPDDPVP